MLSTQTRPYTARLVPQNRRDWFDPRPLHLMVRPLHMRAQGRASGYVEGFSRSGDMDLGERTGSARAPRGPKQSHAGGRSRSQLRAVAEAKIVGIYSSAECPPLGRFGGSKRQTILQKSWQIRVRSSKSNGVEASLAVAYLTFPRSQS